MAGTTLVVEPRPRTEPATTRKLDPCVMVIFGGTGDLARRKLMPALYDLARGNGLPDKFAVVGVSRSASSADDFRKLHQDSVAKFSRAGGLDASVWKRFAGLLDVVKGDVNDKETYRKLGERLAGIDRERGTLGNRIFYFATAASAFPPLLDGLRDAGLVRRDGKAPWTRVVIEKPFGHDLESARELNEQAAKTLDEKQIFRIDHYLGKETVQNILVFRFGNAIFEPLWNRKYVDHVEITAAESIGIEARGAFYDETGVVRDMVQNHLLQVLACCAMECPVSFSADDVRDEKVQVFRSLRPVEGKAVARELVLGQYRGYRQEPGVRRDSKTPTYAALRVFLDTWRWQGVPFYLRSGKKLAKRVTEIAIQFKEIPICLFPQDSPCIRDPNLLVIRIAPDEGIALRFACKSPGDELETRAVTMDFSYAQAFQKPNQEAYERLLRDVMRGDATLFWRRDEVERAWAFATPILRAYEGDPAFPVPEYEPGSDGPREAAELLRRDGREWRALA